VKDTGEAVKETVDAARATVGATAGDDGRD
jgi:hypothetical protein